jgi:voltage-gated potassium channel
MNFFHDHNLDSPAARRSSVLRACALVLCVPTYYLLWTERGVLGFAAAALWLTSSMLMLLAVRYEERVTLRRFDIALAVALAATVWLPLQDNWPSWLPRLVVASALAVRVVMDARVLLRIERVWIPLAFAALSWAATGVGFYWLDPRVHSVADGLWLAFTTGATVGYGDLVPSTPATRVLAVFVVLLGYTFLSLITAAMVALLLGREERAQMLALHRDIAALRAELRRWEESFTGVAPQPGTHASALPDQEQITRTTT